jgi:hypothetical protein
MRNERSRETRLEKSKTFVFANDAKKITTPNFLNDFKYYDIQSIL